MHRIIRFGCSLSCWCCCRRRQQFDEKFEFLLSPLNRPQLKLTTLNCANGKLGRKNGVTGTYYLNATSFEAQVSILSAVVLLTAAIEISKVVGFLMYVFLSQSYYFGWEICRKDRKYCRDWFLSHIDWCTDFDGYAYLEAKETDQVKIFESNHEYQRVFRYQCGSTMWGFTIYILRKILRFQIGHQHFLFFLSA